MSILLIIIFVSVFFSYRNLSGGCRATIYRYTRANKALSQDQTTLIYLIRNVSVCCRPCYDYERYKDSSFNIVFFVEEDFTDTDIENFRNAFHIDLKHEINRKNETLESICGACEKKSSNSNFLLILDKQGKLFDLIRF